MIGQFGNDFTRLRKQMVEEQLKNRDIVDKRLLTIMGRVPREEFVPEEFRDQAYLDGPLPIGQGQTISQPYIVALMTQLLELEGQEKVLEIGTGSGYQAAILAYLAKEVFSIERHPWLLKRAAEVLAKLGIKNIKVKVADGSRGWPEEALFNAIIVTAAAPRVPTALIEQLADGGRLVVPVGEGGWQELIRLTKKGKELNRESFGGVAFVPLIIKKTNNHS